MDSSKQQPASPQLQYNLQFALLECELVPGTVHGSGLKLRILEVHLQPKAKHQCSQIGQKNPHACQIL